MELQLRSSAEIAPASWVPSGPQTVTSVRVPCRACTTTGWLGSTEPGTEATGAADEAAFDAASEPAAAEDEADTEADAEAEAGAAASAGTASEAAPGRPAGLMFTIEATSPAESRSALLPEQLQRASGARTTATATTVRALMGVVPSRMFQ